MCGIAGIVRWKAPVENAELTAMTAAVAHRGPDGAGVFIRDRVGLGHRRLSIIDLELGRQPMSNEDEQVWVTFNGEIYNFQELRAELTTLGHVFKSHSDTEVIVHAWEQWGTSCVERFRGMFAFCIADFRQRLLYLARDHFGIKPLYWRRGDGFLAFGSEFGAILAANAARPSGVLRSIEIYFRYGYIPAPLTVYEDVYKLPPAHWMTVGFDGKINAPQPYWKISFQPETETYGDEEWKRRLDATLADSVKAHLVSDVPFGVFLSGGIDSTLVALYMGRLLGRSIKGFSIGFQEQAYSELQYAEHVANTLGFDLHSEVVKSENLSILPDLIKHYGEPFGDSSCVPTWHVAQLARSHVPMVLSGDGGDEAFGGYHTYSAWMGLSPGRRVKNALRGSMREGILPLGRLLLERIHRGTWHRLDHWQMIVNQCSAADRRRLWRDAGRSLIDEECAVFSDAARDARNCDRLAFAQYLDFQTYLPGSILTKVDVASMYHGLEVRTPLIDLRILELAQRLPVSQRIRNHGKAESITKFLPKNLLAESFAPNFVYRRKQGFSIPRDEWFLPGHAGRQMLQEFMATPNSPLYDILNRTGIESILSEHSRTRDNSAPLWLLLVLAIWLEQNPGITFK